MTRVKPVNIIPTMETLDDVDAALARIAALKRQVVLVKAEMNEEVARVKKSAALKCAPAKQDIAALEQGISRYAEARKAEIFSARKSVGLSFGVIGFRASTKLKPRRKWTWDRVLQTLRDRGMRGFMRVKEEVDKEALKGLDPQKLMEIGVEAIQEDAFYYEVEELEIGAVQNGNAA